MKKNPYLTAGCLLAGLLAAMIVLGFFWTPYDPTAMSAEKFLSPSLRHLMGTDNFGRDILSRVLEGAGTTLFIAATAVAAGLFFGILIGAFV